MLAQVLANYLRDHVSFGVYSGVAAADLTTVMHLDLGVQLSYTLLNIRTDKDSAWEEYLHSSGRDAAKERLFSDLINWLILNYSGSKTKTSPVGSRIYQLSANVEALLAKVTSDPAVSLALPLLMRSILATDSKLRELVSQGINFERAVQIQRSVNTLFLSLFKSWVQSDSVAKKFLTELNGFDFLLDRLFSKPQALHQEESTPLLAPLELGLDPWGSS